MLSELCVRRPVTATMLVMSLVVLGIFSFRTLGVDLYPKADPATVNVTCQRAGSPESGSFTYPLSRSTAQNHEVVAVHDLTFVSRSKLSRQVPGRPAEQSWKFLRCIVDQSAGHHGAVFVAKVDGITGSEVTLHADDTRR